MLLCVLCVHMYKCVHGTYIINICVGQRTLDVLFYLHLIPLRQNLSRTRVRLAVRKSLRSSSLHPQQSWVYRSVYDHTWVFTWMLRSQTLVTILVKQVLLPLSHTSSPRTSSWKDYGCKSFFLFQW